MLPPTWRSTVRVLAPSRRLFAVLPVVAWLTLGAAATVQSATVQGALRYAGSPVTATFSNMQSGFVGAYAWSTQTWYKGTVNIGGNTYSIPNLPAGTYSIFVRLSPTLGISAYMPFAGDVAGQADNVTVAGGSTVTKDLDVLAAIHVIQPLDNATTWAGDLDACPKGAQVPSAFTLAWDAVPQATAYQVVVTRWGCGDDSLSTESYDVTATSASLLQSQVDGEQFIVVTVTASAGATTLSTMPYTEYEGGASTKALFFRPSSVAGRYPSPNSAFVAQVAHLPGLAPSFWKSDVTLTNPGETAITAELAYTARDADGATQFLEAEATIPAHACRTFSDLVDTVFHTTGAGSLAIYPAALEVATRTYSTGASPGTFGQGFPPVASNQVAYLSGPSASLGAGGVVKGAFRTNLALVEVWGETAQVKVALLDRDGVELGEKNVNLKAFGNTQLNDVVGQLGGPSTLAEGQVTVQVTSGQGRVAGALSIVDNTSQDPVTIPLNRR